MGYFERLQDAIRHMHGCESEHVATVPVTESFQGKTVWRGDVEIFNLRGHPQAQKAYAWGYQGEDNKAHYTAVLGLSGVDSPEAAVRASIIAKVKK